MGNLTYFLQRHMNQIIAIVTPLLLLPLPLLVTDQKGTCGFLLVLMAVYWCTETLPLGVTGLIPVFLLPLFGIMSTQDVCKYYLQDTTMMFTGGLIVALAIENSNLHKRIGLRVLRTCGTKPQWLMLGFMLPTWFLSMWICNTATTAMVLPIMEAVLKNLNPSVLQKKGTQENGDVPIVDLANDHIKSEKLGDENLSFKGDVYVIDGNRRCKASYELESMSEQPTTSSENNESTIPKDTQDIEDEEEAEYFNLSKGMTLAVAYSANVGGLATLTGAIPNTIMKGHADDLWAKRGLGESPVTYSSWFAMGFPVSVLCFVGIWLWLQLYYLGIRGTCGCCTKSARNLIRTELAQRAIEKEHDNLGPIRFAEVAAGSCFVCLVLLWFFRAPGFMDGWATFFEPGYIGDAVPAMFLGCLAFLIPMELPKWGKQHGSARVKAILSWDVIHHKLPWSVIFLMGGGFALAGACERSGLSQWIGDQLSVFGSLPGWLMLFIICSLVALLTEVTSNPATCNIMMPIMASMAESLGMNPLYLMFPAAMSTSFAFMLPVATPPNALAFSYGRLKVLDMVKAGAILNLLGVLVVTLAGSTWMMAYFDLKTLPWDLDRPLNGTTIAP